MPATRLPEFFMIAFFFLIKHLFFKKIFNISMSICHVFISASINIGSALMYFIALTVAMKVRLGAITKSLLLIFNVLKAK